MSYALISRICPQLFPAQEAILAAQNDNYASEFDDASYTLEELVLEEEHTQAYLQYESQQKGAPAVVKQSLKQDYETRARNRMMAKKLLFEEKSFYQSETVLSIVLISCRKVCR